MGGKICSCMYLAIKLHSFLIRLSIAQNSRTYDNEDIYCRCLYICSVIALRCISSLIWSQVQTGGQPSPRSATAFGYDPLGNQLIVFSGFGGSNDTWIFDIDSGNWSEVQLTQPAPPSRGLAYYGVVPSIWGESFRSGTGDPIRRV